MRKSKSQVKEPSFLAVVTGMGGPPTGVATGSTLFPFAHWALSSLGVSPCVVSLNAMAKRVVCALLRPREWSSRTGTCPGETKRQGSDDLPHASFFYTNASIFAVAACQNLPPSVHFCGTARLLCQGHPPSIASESPMAPLGRGARSQQRALLSLSGKAHAPIRTLMAAQFVFWYVNHSYFGIAAIRYLVSVSSRRRVPSRN